MATSFKRLWTVAVVDSDSEKPVVDLVYCDHEPTWAEVVKIHPHLDQYSPDEDGVFIEEYTKPDNAPRIPSIL